MAAAALLGLLIGSFLNVVVHRLPRSESLVSPGSRCPSCGAAIAPYDNVPVLSWILLRGRCRHCEARISARYPGVELATAIVFATVVALRGLDSHLLIELPLAAALIALAGIDLDYRILPNRIVYPLAIWGLVAVALVDTSALIEHVAAGAGALAFFLAAVLVYPAGMGMGDVKLAGAMGISLGLSIIPALFLAFLTGSLVGLAIMAREGAAARKKAVPFGVFLALGGIAALLVGPELIELYEHNLLD